MPKNVNVIEYNHSVRAWGNHEQFSCFFLHVFNKRVSFTIGIRKRETLADLEINVSVAVEPHIAYSSKKE